MSGILCQHIFTLFIKFEGSLCVAEVRSLHTFGSRSYVFWIRYMSRMQCAAIRQTIMTSVSDSRDRSDIFFMTGASPGLPNYFGPDSSRLLVEPRNKAVRSYRQCYLPVSLDFRAAREEYRLLRRMHCSGHSLSPTHVG